jgi:hypothetical protein
MTIVFFDYETGGVTPQHPNIQLAALAVDIETWRELDSFERKIQFNEAEADPEALKMNHYSREVWEREAAPSTVVHSEFSAMLKRHADVQMVSKRTGRPYQVARLAGYNSATFDGPRLKEEFSRIGAFLPAHPFVMDVLHWASWELQLQGVKLENLKLGTVFQHLTGEAPGDAAHDALHDVRSTIAIARRLGRSAAVAA